MNNRKEFLNYQNSKYDFESLKKYKNFVGQSMNFYE
jgi:hypothetical protein